jgi:PKD repeat protein
VAYWRFDEGAGEVAHDASGNGRDGILVNGPTWVTPDPHNLWIEATYINVAVGYVVSFTARDTGPMLQTLWNFGDGTTVTNQPVASHAWSAPGVYTVRLTGYNDSHPDGVMTSIEVTVTDTVYHVNPASSNPVSPYTSWQTAAVTIQEAVDAARVPGALVRVTNGVYATGVRAVDGKAINRVVIDKQVRVESVNGPQFTLIEGYQVPGTTNGDGAIRCVYLANGARLSGFTLTNGATRTAGDREREQSGGGVWCASTNEVLTNCVLTGNSASEVGGGAYGGTLVNCTLTGNWGYYGGGACDATLNNCLLTDNRADIGGGAATCTLNNCALTGNSADIGGGGAHDGTLNHCTVTGNTGGTQGGGGVDECTLTNCIVYYNTAPVYANYDWQSRLIYGCTTPLPAGAGNLEAEPQLANAFRLSASSPCLGNGSHALVTGVDIDGEPWAIPPSIGCDEYHAGSLTGPLTVSLRVAYTNVAAGYAAVFTGGIEGRVSASRWEFGDGTVVSNRPHASHAWALAGDYPVVLRGDNESHPEGVTATLAVRVVTQPVHYVAAGNPTPAAPYSSWATAATNI